MWQRRLGKQVCHIPRGSYTAYARRRGASRAYLDVDHGCTLQMSISPHEQRRCLDTAPKGRLCVVRRSRGPLLRTSRASGIDWRAAAKRGVKGQARKSIECKQWVLQVGSPIGPMGCVRRRRGGEAVPSAAGRGAAWWMSLCEGPCISTTHCMPKDCGGDEDVVQLLSPGRMVRRDVLLLRVLAALFCLSRMSGRPEKHHVAVPQALPGPVSRAVTSDGHRVGRRTEPGLCSFSPSQAQKHGRLKSGAQVEAGRSPSRSRLSITTSPAPTPTTPRGP